MNSRITLFANEYAHMWYYSKEGIIHHQLLQPISGEEFQNLLCAGLFALKEHRANKWLSDDRLNTILSAEDSAWSQDYWLPRAYKAGWRYWAVLPPIKARGEINMQRITGYVDHLPKIKIEIFDDPDEAWQWLAHLDENCEQ